MAEPLAPVVDDALDELVNQFSDPLAFLRELVQNSIDAGTSEIEIETTSSPKQGVPGHVVALISVSDWGGGMSREIVETKLTRLFSSNKDGDRTKIGKFGIGFVSVFAIEPDAVCVDTARDGEAWRVLFDEQRRFKLLRLDEPIEGTRIRVFKTMPTHEFEGFAKRVHDTVKFWCRHAQLEIRVDDQSIAEPFPFDAPCAVEHDDGYSRIAAAHPLNGASFFGLYNGGLTLVEQPHRKYEGLAIKAWSPHLEHTLTRDAVIKDDGHTRVMQGVAAVVEERLCMHTFVQLTQELARPMPTAMRDYWLRCAAWHIEHHPLPKEALHMTVAYSPSGRGLSVDALRDDPKRSTIYTVRQRSPLSDAAEQEGLCVVVAAPDSGMHRLLVAATRRQRVQCVELGSEYALALRAEGEREEERWQRLARTTHALFRKTSHNVADVLIGRFAYPGSPIASEVAIASRDPWGLNRREVLKVLGRGILSLSRPVVVNADHPTVAALVQLADRDPLLAAFMLTKLFFLGEGLTERLDGELASAVQELSR